MQGDVEESKGKKQVHWSADDLNDGFILDKEDKRTLSYQVSVETSTCRSLASLLCF